MAERRVPNLAIAVTCGVVVSLLPATHVYAQAAPGLPQARPVMSVAGDDAVSDAAPEDPTAGDNTTTAPAVYDGTHKLIGLASRRAPGSAISTGHKDEIIDVYGNGNVAAYRNVGTWQDANYSSAHSKIVANGGFRPGQASFADLNGDRKDEIIDVRADGNVYAFLNVGGIISGTTYDGTCKRAAQPVSPDRTRFGDLNGHGHADIVENVRSGEVHAYWNQGDGWGSATYVRSDHAVVATSYTW